MGRNLALGAMGEELAASALTAAGLQILDRNWRCRHGELDLVAVDGDTVVFVEVKTRSGLGFGSPAEAVTYAKQRRIRMLAQRWLAASERHWTYVRFDVVSVLVDRRREPEVTHLTAVF
ncbi:putative endonuclease [Rhodococcus sp. OK519]|uniref:YraN family protein n=1 Tax=Rhodococcus sp. OK519 TaxID=2135729 RepID=UPI000D33DE08|nr:putative endonuclease [Rhodococcus sp. OK519]